MIVFDIIPYSRVGKVVLVPNVLVEIIIRQEAMVV